MHKPIDRTTPHCAKCSQPMTWHSDQEVHTREGELLMRVFACESCDRLAAFADPAITAKS